MKITEQEDIHFVAIGDWGSGDQHQEEVGEHFLTLFDIISQFFNFHRLLQQWENFAS